jgi:hypothetical protein
LTIAEQMLEKLGDCISNHTREQLIMKNEVAPLTERLNSQRTADYHPDSFTKEEIGYFMQELFPWKLDDDVHTMISIANPDHTGIVDTKDIAIAFENTQKKEIYRQIYNILLSLGGVAILTYTSVLILV